MLVWQPALVSERVHVLVLMLVAQSLDGQRRSVRSAQMRRFLNVRGVGGQGVWAQIAFVSHVPARLQLTMTGCTAQANRTAAECAAAIAVG